MEKYQLRPNRALGQNFLMDPEALERIAAAAAEGGLPVLEIGAGLGALTEALICRGAQVTAVEKDGRLAQILTAEQPAAKVLHADFLHADLASLTGGADFSAAGNLPYYVTTPICERLLAALPARAVVMVQSEAAERFFAAPHARVYGPLAVLAQTYYAPERLMDVPPQAFWPQPEVDSTVVLFLRRGDVCGEPAAFLHFLKTAFAMRRKTLANNFQKDPRLASALEECGLPLNARSEALTPEALCRLWRAMDGR